MIPVALIYHNVGFLNFIPVAEPESEFGKVEYLISIDHITLFVFQPFSLGFETDDFFGSVES